MSRIGECLDGECSDGECSDILRPSSAVSLELLGCLMGAMANRRHVAAASDAFKLALVYCRLSSSLCLSTAPSVRYCAGSKSVLATVSSSKQALSLNPDTAHKREGEAKEEVRIMVGGVKWQDKG